MAIGRQWGAIRAIRRAPLRGPQSFLDELDRQDVIGFTRTQRAAELSAQPSMVSRTYFGAYKPGTAQRIPPAINTGYGAQYASSERVRSTLVARARIFASSLRLNQGTTVQQVDAGRSQAAKAQGG